MAREVLSDDPTLIGEMEPERRLARKRRYAIEVAAIWMRVDHGGYIHSDPISLTISLTISLMRARIIPTAS
jgi:hypothetical protein